MPRSLRRRLRIVTVVLVAVLVAAACSSSGFPTAYDDQLNPETGQSNVEQNFLEGCQVGQLGELDEASELQGEAADAVCRCSYSRITSDIPFDDFVAADEQLNDSPELLRDPPNGSTVALIAEIIVDCICQTPTSDGQTSCADPSSEDA